MNDLDRDIINQTRKMWIKIRDRFRRQSPVDGNTGGDDATNNEARKEAFTRFILTLSDQQLVTGLAILIAGIAGQNYLTGYEFDIALGLAWFSSTTHMATLDALRKYFRHHSIIHNFRVAGMLALLVLLTYMFSMSIVFVDNTLPVQCFFPSSGNRFTERSHRWSSRPRYDCGVRSGIVPYRFRLLYSNSEVILRRTTA